MKEFWNEAKGYFYGASIFMLLIFTIALIMPWIIKFFRWYMALISAL